MYNYTTHIHASLFMPWLESLNTYSQINIVTATIVHADIDIISGTKMLKRLIVLNNVLNVIII